MLYGLGLVTEPLWLTVSKIEIIFTKERLKLQILKFVTDHKIGSCVLYGGPDSGLSNINNFWREVMNMLLSAYLFIFSNTTNIPKYQINHNTQNK